ncbi:MAG: tRNA-dependent cyclodipeptide synthase [Cyanobacteria bacterium P01_B01_bin.77]
MLNITHQLTDFLNTLIYDRDLIVFEKKRLALIGISLNNSYFTESKLTTILTGFSHHFEQVKVVLADSIAIHNYKALGYSNGKAQKKVKKHTNQMSNRIIRSMNCIKQENISLIFWQEIEAFPGYADGLSKVCWLYENNSDFLADVHTTTIKVMNKHMTEPAQKWSILQEAKWYLLKELALAYCAPDFFSTSLLTCYYQDFPIYRKMLHGHYTGIPVKNHGFLAYEALV